MSSLTCICSCEDTDGALLSPWRPVYGFSAAVNSNCSDYPQAKPLTDDKTCPRLINIYRYFKIFEREDRFGDIRAGRLCQVCKAINSSQSLLP